MHALSHPLGGLKGMTLHHGTLNAVVMPAVLRFNAAVHGIGVKYARLKRTLGLDEGIDLADWIAKLNARIGLPPGLRAMGVKDDMLPGIVPHALADHTAATNPRPLTADGVKGLLKEAMG